MLDTTGEARAAGVLQTFGNALEAGDVETAVAQFADDLLLARPRQLHLEHQDAGEPGRDPRHAAEPARGGEAHILGAGAERDRRPRTAA